MATSGGGNRCLAVRRPLFLPQLQITAVAVFAGIRLGLREAGRMAKGPLNNN